MAEKSTVGKIEELGQPSWWKRLITPASELTKLEIQEESRRRHEESWDEANSNYPEEVLMLEEVRPEQYEMCAAEGAHVQHPFIGVTIKPLSIRDDRFDLRCCMRCGLAYWDKK